MNSIKLITLLACVVAAYSGWHKHRERVAHEQMMSSFGSLYGFVPLPPPTGLDTSKVLVLAPIGCPREVGQRARALVQELKERHIPYAEVEHIGFTMEHPDGATMDRLNTVLGGEGPVVLVHGAGKANPSIDEVAAEFGSRK